MKYTFTILFSFTLFINAKSQLLNIDKPLFSDEPFFDSKFVRENKIKSIIGSRSSKKIQDIIRSKGLDFYYEFNDKGQLQKQIATFLVNGTSKDTNLITYEYNNLGYLILKRKSDNYGFYSYQYLLDSLNRIIKTTYNREENIHSSKNIFELCKRYKISSDSYFYQKLNDTQTKKFFYNNYNKLYKQQINYYNEFNYLIEKYTKSIIGNNKNKTTYKYDENGRLKEQRFSNITKKWTTTKAYEYDNWGNLITIQFYTNGKHVTTKQFIYDKKTMLLTAQIIQDIQSEFLKIIQYEYTFFKN